MQDLKQLDKEQFAKDLINWYERIKRDLPWRENQDPYRIWISEIMLQQTQVNTVIPYYLRFMEQFPTILDLALAEEETVLKAWEGLGYYSRARNIHATAKTIVNHYQGKFPTDYDTILSLKGIGSYTAGAISSIAYGLPKPAVDGNVMRVMSRVLEIWEDIAKAKTKTIFETIVSEIIPESDPSSFNQGLMELGALICTPKGQKCLECPVMPHCKAYHKGCDDQLPVKINKTKQKTIPYITGILQNEENAYLMRQRNEDLLANMWEFIQVEGTQFKDFEEYLLYHFDLKLLDAYKLGEWKHVFSHRIWLMVVYQVKVIQNDQLPESFKWMTKDEMLQVPIATAHRKIIDCILE
jgi:A/G-specific adenine glycosylase